MPKRRNFTRENDEDGFECPIFQNVERDNLKINKNSDDSDGSVHLTDQEPDNEDSDFDNESDDSTDEKRNVLGNESDTNDEDDDEAPTAVSFKSSKQSVMDTIKNVRQQITKDKQRNKGKRKDQENRNKEQKKLKLDALAQKKLPDDFFEGLPEESLKIPSMKKQKMKKNADDIDGDEEEGSLADTEDDFGDGNEQDFLPLELDRLSGEPQAVVLQKYQQEKTKSSAERAADFKRNQIFGRRIPRESSKSKLAKSMKKKVFVSR